MDSWVRFSAQSDAKEKIFRSTQYACTLLGFTLKKCGVGSDLLNTVKQLETHVSLTRKLMRLGNSVSALEAAKRAIHLSDSVLRLCLTVAHLNRAMYFACDNVLWAGKIGLLPQLNQEQWSQRSFRYYLFALILSLTRDVYEIQLLMEREARRHASKSTLASSSSSPPSPSPESDTLPYPVAPALVSFSGAAVPDLHARLRRQAHLLATVLHSNPPLLLDLLKNTCDLFIPLDRLGIYPTGQGFVGACGLASSILSILTIIHPWLKLKP